VDEFILLQPDADLEFSRFRDQCLEKQVRWIIPTRDGELERLAIWSPGLLEAGIATLISPVGTVRACLDKLEFSRRLEGHPGFLPTLTRLDTSVASRWVVKDRYGSGSRGVGLNLLAAEAEEAAGRLAHPIFQPYVGGPEYSIDVYVGSQGVPWGCVVRSRDMVRHGESQVSTVVEDPRLEKLVMDAALLLGVRGHAVFQAIKASRGEFRLVECNCRLGGASTLSMAAGMDSPAWFFMETQNRDFLPEAFVRGKPGLRLIRYSEDRFVEVPDWSDDRGSQDAEG